MALEYNHIPIEQSQQKLGTFLESKVSKKSKFSKTFLVKVVIIFSVKSMQKEQNNTNLLLRPPICHNESAMT